VGRRGRGQPPVTGCAGETWPRAAAPLYFLFFPFFCVGRPAVAECALGPLRRRACARRLPFFPAALEPLASALALAHTSHLASNPASHALRGSGDRGHGMVGRVAGLHVRVPVRRRLPNYKGEWLLWTGTRSPGDGGVRTARPSRRCRRAGAAGVWRAFGDTLSVREPRRAGLFPASEKAAPLPHFGSNGCPSAFRGRWRPGRPPPPDGF
jgi:hypothetical protein